MTTENKKNNNKILLIVAIIVVVAAGSLYGYRVHKINQLRAEAMSTVEAFDVSKYDGKELKTVKNCVKDAEGKLEASKDPEEFTKIVKSFKKDTAKVKTTAQKEKERKAKEEAERKAREAEAARQAAAARSSKKSGGSDSHGCVGGGSGNFY